MVSNKVFILWSKRHEQFKVLKSLLEADGWTFIQSIDSQFLHDIHDNLTYCLAIVDLLDYCFTIEEQQLIKKFCFNEKSSLIVASSENESHRNKSNLNDIVSAFGIKFNADCVIRPNPYKLYHPKHVMLEDFAVNRGLGETLKKYLKTGVSEQLPAESKLSSGPKILYPDGCTLKVNKTSTIVMTTSKWAMPSEQAICCFYKNSTSFRMIAIGSASLISDTFIHCEDNMALVKTLLEFITNKQFSINISDAKTIEVPASLVTPDIIQLANNTIPCLEESEPLPDDKLSLIDRRLFSIDTSNLPTIMRAYKDLNVLYEPLTVVKPSLTVNPIKLEPATCGFLLRR